MDFIVIIPILIMSAVIHEVAHGLAALWLGDSTAKYEGRLTLNPLKHLDPFTSIILPLLLIVFRSPFVFAAAKPVPYNPYNLRNQKYGPALVGAAGPLLNILIALIFGFCLRLFLVFGVVSAVEVKTVLVGIFYGGSILGAGASAIVIIFEIVISLNVLLAIFNLVPIPPLDGSKLLFSVFPVSEETKFKMEYYGSIFIFPLIIIFSGPIFFVIRLVQVLFFRAVVGA